MYAYVFLVFKKADITAPDFFLYFCDVLYLRVQMSVLYSRLNTARDVFDVI